MRYLKLIRSLEKLAKKVTEMGNGNIYGLIDGGKQMNRMDVMARSLAAAAGGKVAATQKVLTDNGVAPYDSKGNE